AKAMQAAAAIGLAARKDTLHMRLIPASLVYLTMPERLMIQYAAADEPIIKAAAQRNPLSTSVSGSPLVFMPKIPVTSVGGSSLVVTIENLWRGRLLSSSILKCSSSSNN